MIAPAQTPHTAAANRPPSYLVLHAHCQERAMERFNFNLSLTAWFDMVNRRIPSVVVGQRIRRRKGRGKEFSELVQFAGIPGTWVRRGKWVTTCWGGKIG